MTTGDGEMRDVVKEVLAEVLPAVLDEALATPGRNGNGTGAEHRVELRETMTEGTAAVPQVPGPPIAAVHRPSGWRAPEVPDSVGDAPRVPVPDGVATEHVDLRSDADLEAFVRSLARRFENPDTRAAILSGALQFQLGTAASAAPPTIRIETGAVTERAVKDAAKSGARLVLSPRAVLTPMARDRARSLGVEIQKETRC